MERNEIRRRIALLRDAMRKNGLDAYIVPTEDPHMSEYPADCWKCREWISGFTGSAGTVVVTSGKAGLWTDSRYFLQAETQLEGTGIDLYRLKIEGTPSIADFLTDNLEEGMTAGIDGKTCSISLADSYLKALSEKGIGFVTDVDLFDGIWEGRPSLPASKAWEMPLSLCGRTTGSKIEDINRILSSKGADCTVISALDEVAWTFNIRGNDVNYNPVLVAYAFVSPQATVLFIDDAKLPGEIRARLQGEGVEVLPYDGLAGYLSKLPAGAKVLLDKDHTNVAVRDCLADGCTIVGGIAPANSLKSIKNSVEIDGFRSAVLKDGIAMTRFYIWLEEMLGKGERVTELSAAEKLRSLRAAQPGFITESFAPISSYGPHGAVVHYSPTPETDVELKCDNLYLLDSGAQYEDGTTDITRTIALCDAPTRQMRSDFTAALRGTIGIALCRFPAGIRGCLVDAFARKALWEAGINYLHGTCHGIGHCLNVHEGPQSIRMEENPVVLEAGMVMSDEPAMYRAGQYGIRTENMVMIKEVEKTEFGTFLGFETLTLCYIDMKLVDMSVMTEAERRWLEGYQAWVYETLSPYLTESERVWLGNKTKCGI